MVGSNKIKDICRYPIRHISAIPPYGVTKPTPGGQTGTRAADEGPPNPAEARIHGSI